MNIFQCRFDCAKCNKAEADEGEDDEDEEEEELGASKRLKHCHCPLWKPSKEMITSMSGGQPSHRYKEELKKRKVESDAEAALYNIDEVTRKEQRKKVLRESLARLKRRLTKEAAKKMKEQIAEASKKKSNVGEAEKERKRRHKEDKDKRIAEKRSRLSFLE